MTICPLCHRRPAFDKFCAECDLGIRELAAEGLRKLESYLKLWAAFNETENAA